MSRQKQVEVPGWNLLLVPDDEDPSLLPFGSFDEMLKALREIEALACYAVFPFFGLRCHVNRAAGDVELYYLRHPSGELHPLFDSQPGVVEIADGHFGGGETAVAERPTGARRYSEDEEIVESQVTVYEEVFDADEPEADLEDPDEDDTDALEPYEGSANFP